MKPEDILQGHTREVKKIAGALRKFLMEVEPMFAEKAYPGWHAIGYRHPQVGYVCGIFPFKNTVKLLFEYGAYLPDEDGVLEGETKQTRHIELSQVKDIPYRSIKKLVVQAVELRK